MNPRNSLLAEIGNEFLAIAELGNRLNDPEVKGVTRDAVQSLINEKRIFVAKLIAIACKQDKHLSQSVHMALYTNKTFIRRKTG